MKPKLHLVKHAALELHEWLGEGLEYLPNFNLHNTEQNEDQIGRVCRLSRRIDSRHVGQRGLGLLLPKMKPKLHLVKHAALELHEWLGEGLEYLPNFNLHKH